MWNSQKEYYPVTTLPKQTLKPQSPCFGGGYLQVQGDLANRLIMGITRVLIRVMGLMNLLTKYVSPES